MVLYDGILRCLALALLLEPDVCCYRWVPCAEVGDSLCAVVVEWSVAVGVASAPYVSSVTRSVWVSVLLVLIEVADVWSFDMASTACPEVLCFELLVEALELLTLCSVSVEVLLWFGCCVCAFVFVFVELFVSVVEVIIEALVVCSWDVSSEDSW